MERIFGERVVNPVLQGVNVDDIVRRIDWNSVVDRIDLDAALQRVDLNSHLDRVDVDALLQRVDVNSLIDRSNLNSIIVRSTTGLFTHILDAFRALVIRADQIVQDLARCYPCRRRCRKLPRWLPPKPNQQFDATLLESCPKHMTDLAVASQGRNAGIVSQVVAWIIDELIILLTFAIFVAAIDQGFHFVTHVMDNIRSLYYSSSSSNVHNPIRFYSWMRNVFSNQQTNGNKQKYTTTTTTTTSTISHNDGYNSESVDSDSVEALYKAVFLYCWGIVYTALALCTIGRTIGMTIVGLLVVVVKPVRGSAVSHNMTLRVIPVTFVQAWIRAVATSLIALVAMTSWVGWIRYDRRQLHDMLTCTTVIYSWDTRILTMRSTIVTEAERLEPTWDSDDDNDNDTETMALNSRQGDKAGYSTINV